MILQQHVEMQIQKFSTTSYIASIIKTANIHFFTNIMDIYIFIQTFQDLTIGFVNLKNLFIIIIMWAKPNRLPFWSVKPSANSKWEEQV